MPSIGPTELIVVLVIALIVFGPKKLPELGRSLGRGLREFKQSVSGHDDDDAEPPRELASGDDAGESHESRSESTTHT